MWAADQCETPLWSSGGVLSGDGVVLFGSGVPLLDSLERLFLFPLVAGLLAVMLWSEGEHGSGFAVAVALLLEYLVSESLASRCGPVACLVAGVPG